MGQRATFLDAGDPFAKLDDGAFDPVDFGFDPIDLGFKAADGAGQVLEPPRGGGVESEGGPIAIAPWRTCVPRRMPLG